MQHLAPLLLAISLLAGSAPALAQTQQSSAPSPSASPMGTSTQTQPAPNAAAGTAGPTFGELISSLNDMRSEVAKVQSMNGGSANNIRPVNVSQLPGSNPSALSSAVTKNRSQLNALRNALGRVTVTTATNERITVAQFLADNKISATQIVGADVNNGVLVLFYQKP